jgi:hypothetical protein
MEAAMALSDLAEKLAEYRARLDAGHADRISPAHVDRVVDKLEAKRARLVEELATATAAPSGSGWSASVPRWRPSSNRLTGYATGSDPRWRLTPRAP